MITRPRLLQAANALLYMGPLLAGLAGYGWVSVPIFAAIFTLWQMILRPQDWQVPGSRVVSLVARIVLQVLVVAGCFGVGRALGGIFSYAPGFHPMLPVAMSFLAIPVSRLVWDGWKEEPEPATDPVTMADPRLGAARLLGLPANLPLDEALAEVRGTLKGPQATSCLDLVKGGLSTPGEDRPSLRRALMLWATEPEVVVAESPRGTVRAAWQVCFKDEALLRVFLPRARALLAAFPDRAADFPTLAMLRPAAPGMTDPRLAFEIEEMADALEAIARPRTTAQQTAPEPAPKRQLVA
jgi:hypothetical protein